ncbi:MAG: hypothetical protein K6T83_18885, partial [Alicyclobacillus sp.]|nr:hypothetical protein [Alicyclobacillus sp.]
MNALKPYINDALIGNSGLLATLNQQGRLLRAFWPHVDHGQHIGCIDLGVCAHWHDRPRWLHDAPDTA